MISQRLPGPYRGGGQEDPTPSPRDIHFCLKGRVNEECGRPPVCPSGRRRASPSPSRRAVYRRKCMSTLGGELRLEERDRRPRRRYAPNPPTETERLPLVCVRTCVPRCFSGPRSSIGVCRCGHLEGLGQSKCVWSRVSPDVS